MKILSNDSKIKRNTKIAQYASLASIIVIVISVYLFVTRPDQFVLVWTLVLVGFVMTQISTYLTNRWGRRPRADEHLNLALKGLDNSYSLYHYTTPVSHLLVGPAGIWVLLPRYQKGTITYNKGRWRQKGGGFFHNYMKIFGQEGLGRPDLEIEAEKDSIQKHLEKLLPGVELPPIQAALLFTSEGLNIEADDAPVPTLPVKKLKELIKKRAKTRTLTPEKAKLIQEALEGNQPATEKVGVEIESE